MVTDLWAAVIAAGMVAFPVVVIVLAGVAVAKMWREWRQYRRDDPRR
jgi:hypothetical protein